jgi:creatinine amidohydrolase
VPSGYWQELTTTDFAALDAEEAIALLPVAAIEQHGPHLPLVTDRCIAEGIVARTLEMLPEETTLLVLPTQSVGDSTEHEAFAGTLSGSAQTLIALWTEIGESVARAGLRKLVILNSHGGQPQIVDIVAQRLRLARRMLVVKVNSFRLGCPDGLFAADELAHGIHGGALETSMMLHLKPALVRSDRAEDFRPLSAAMVAEYKRLGSRGATAFAWAAQDLNPAGVCGDAVDADAERGRQVIDHMARALVAVVEDARRFPLSLLRSGPMGQGAEL